MKNAFRPGSYGSDHIWRGYSKGIFPSLLFYYYLIRTHSDMIFRIQFWVSLTNKNFSQKKVIGRDPSLLIMKTTVYIVMQRKFCLQEHLGFRSSFTWLKGLKGSSLNKGICPPLKSLSRWSFRQKKFQRSPPIDAEKQTGEKGREEL